ncbi:MAG: hypothetical protein AB1Z67_02530 [Candidatus Limnocylindrales bacterium]
MRRTIIATAAAVALLAATAASAAAAPTEHPRASYGKGVLVHCSAPFGQLVQASKDVDGHRPVKGGAKAFITTMAALATSEDPAERELAYAHGCFVPEA